MIAKNEPTTAATRLLLVDVGNSRVAVAVCIDNVRREAESLPWDSFDAVETLLARQWEALAGGRRAMLVSSVSPPHLDRIRQACRKFEIAPVLVLGEELNLPIPVDVPEPGKVGSDRLCVAAAAYDRIKGACVVADFGTALTVDLVSDDGVFLGGTILPGVGLSARALHEHTALLPLVEVGRPSEIIGKDTVTAMRSGIFAMMVGALREIAERYATDIGKWPPLVVTGGDAAAIASGCDFVDYVVPHLCLDGLVLAYKQAFADHDDS